MAGAEGLEPSARGFGGNVEIYLTLRLCPNFGDWLPTALLMMEELMLFWWCAEFCTRLLMLLMIDLDSVVWVVTGTGEHSGKHFGGRAMLKNCAAVIKEKRLYEKQSKTASWRVFIMWQKYFYSAWQSYFIGYTFTIHNLRVRARSTKKK